LVVVWFICLCSWKNRLLYSNMCYFGITKVKMTKFATIMENCVQNNLWKFSKRILKYTENNDICLRGSFYCRTLYSVHIDCETLNWSGRLKTRVKNLRLHLMVIFHQLNVVFWRQKQISLRVKKNIWRLNVYRIQIKYANITRVGLSVQDEHNVNYWDTTLILERVDKHCSSKNYI